MTETRCPLPKMARIRQTFARPRVDDMAAEMREQMQVLTPRIRFKGKARRRHGWQPGYS